MANDATNAGADLSTSTDTPPAPDATGEAVAESPNGSKISSTEPKMSNHKFKVGDVVVFPLHGSDVCGVVTDIGIYVDAAKCSYFVQTKNDCCWRESRELRHATAQEAFLAWNKGNPHMTYAKYEEIKKREQQEEVKRQHAEERISKELANSRVENLITTPDSCTVYMPDGTKRDVRSSEIKWDGTTWKLVGTSMPVLPPGVCIKTAVDCCAPASGATPAWRADPIASELSKVEPGPWEEKEVGHEFKVGDRVTLNWDTRGEVGSVLHSARGRYKVFWANRMAERFSWHDAEELDILLEPSGKAAEDTPLSEATQAWIRNWVDATKAKKTMTILSAITALQPPATSEESPPAVVGEQPPRKESSMLKTLAFVGKIGLYASAAFGVAAFGTISLYASGYAPEWLNDTLINTYLRYTEYQDRVFGSIGGLAAAGPLLYGARRLGVSAWQHVTAAFTTALADAVAKGIEDGTAPKK